MKITYQTYFECYNNRHCKIQLRMQPILHTILQSTFLHNHWLWYLSANQFILLPLYYHIRSDINFAFH